MQSSINAGIWNVWRSSPEGIILLVQWKQLAFESTVMAVNRVHLLPLPSSSQNLHGNLDVTQCLCTYVVREGWRKGDERKRDVRRE